MLRISRFFDSAQPFRSACSTFVVFTISALAFIANFLLAPLAALAQSTLPISHASPAPVAHTTLRDAPTQTLGNFDSAFHALSEQAHATILAEGRPLHLTLSEDDLAALKASLANAGTSASGSTSSTVAPSVADTIDRVAEAYDYSAEKVNPHLYLLHKRYTDVHDLPCVTFEEMQNALRQMERLCNQYGGHTEMPNANSPAEFLFHQLTPAQVKKAEDVLTLADLTASQQQIARAAAAAASVGECIVQLHQIVYALDALKSPQTAFQYGPTLMKVQAFQFHGPFGYDGSIYEQPVDKRFIVNTAGYMRLTPILSVMPKTEAEENKAWGLDLTLPADEDRQALRETQQDKSPYRLTLGALAQAIDKPRSASAAPVVPLIDLPSDVSKPVRFTVDSGLAGKVVSVYGMSYSDTNAVIRSLSSLYQLTLLVPKERQYYLVLAKAGDRADEDFNTKIAHLVPGPLQRSHDQQAMLWGKANFDALTDAQKTSKRAAIGKQKITMEKMDHTHALFQAAEKYYYPADHRLLLLAKPLVPTPASSPVPLSQADPDVYRLIALMLYSTSVIRTVDQLIADPLPVFLTRPDALMLRMASSASSTDKQDVLDTEFGYRDEAGNFHRERMQVQTMQHQAARATTPADESTAK